MRLPGSGAAIRNVTRPMRVREVLREHVNLGDAASRVIRQVSTRWPGLFAALLDNAQRAAAVSAAVRPESGQPARTTMPSWSPADCQAAVDASPPQHAADHAPGRSSSGTPGLAAYGVGRWDGITRFADPACIATRLIEHPASPDQHPSLTAAQSPRLVPFRELLDYFEDLALVAGAKPRAISGSGTLCLSIASWSHARGDCRSSAKATDAPDRRLSGTGPDYLPPADRCRGLAGDARCHG